MKRKHVDVLGDNMNDEPLAATTDTILAICEAALKLDAETVDLIVGSAQVRQWHHPALCPEERAARQREYEETARLLQAFQKFHAELCEGQRE